MTVASPPPASKPKPPAPPPPTTARSSAPVVGAASNKTFSVSRGIKQEAKRIVLYGTGGIGKSECFANLEQVGFKPVIIDIEHGTTHIDCARIDTIETWDELRAVLNPTNGNLDGFDFVVIDSGTKAEELATAWTLANIKHEKGHLVSSIEGYGFGKGLTHLYETYLQLLGDLDALCRRGINVGIICHDTTATVPNPAGENFKRYEPRLSSPESGKSSIRSRVREWCDHLLYIGYDRVVGDDGKAKGSGTRTIYGQELPTWLAKSRPSIDPVFYKRGDAEIWKLIFNKE